MWDFAGVGPDQRHLRPAAGPGVRSRAARRREPVGRSSPCAGAIRSCSASTSPRARRSSTAARTSTYRNQFLANDESGTSNAGSSASLGQSSANYTNGLVRRNAWMVIPDLWFQFLYKKFRFEAEGRDGVRRDRRHRRHPHQRPHRGLRQRLQLERQRLPHPPVRRGHAERVPRHRGQAPHPVRLRLGQRRSRPDHPRASRPGAASRSPSRRTAPTPSSPSTRTTASTSSSSATSSPGSRARTTSAPRSSTTSSATRTGRSSAAAPPSSGAAPASFIQAPGHASDLGVELDGKVYFQSRDGTLNDNHEKKGGFYTQLEYGVLFPLAGLGYLPRAADHVREPDLRRGDERRLAQHGDGADPPLVHRYPVLRVGPGNRCPPGPRRLREEGRLPARQSPE